MSSVVFYLYRAIVMPAATLTLPVVALFNSKVREGLRLRRQPAPALPLGSLQPLWIHAASGEFEYAKPLIRMSKERQPDIPIVVTYFSPSFRKAIEATPGVDCALPLPLDLPGPCRSFLRRFKPRALWIARTDLWPEMLHQCQCENVPVMLFSYTQRPWRSRWHQLRTKWRLQWVSQIACVSQADLAAVGELRLPVSVTVMGDTRYDQVAYRLAHPKALPESLKPPPNAPPVMVAGSTWGPDEAVLLPSLAPLLKTQRLRLIVVPHEPTAVHLAELESRCRHLHLTTQRFSLGAPWAKAEVLLVDQVGVLAELYTWGALAFVGGSFVRSVHSVMEPLGAGVRTFVGPAHQNNREAVEFQSLVFDGARAVEVVHDAETLRSAVELALAQPDHLAKFKQQLAQEFARRQGASERLIDCLTIH